MTKTSRELFMPFPKNTQRLSWEHHMLRTSLVKSKSSTPTRAPRSRRSKYKTFSPRQTIGRWRIRGEVGGLSQFWFKILGSSRACSKHHQKSRQNSSILDFTFPSKLERTYITCIKHTGSQFYMPSSSIHRFATIYANP